MNCFSKSCTVTLIRRNILYLRRNWVSTTLDLLLPVAFVFVLVTIKGASENSASFKTKLVNASFPDEAIAPLSFTDYVTALRAKRVCLDHRGNDKAGGGFEISGIPKKLDGLYSIYNWQVPLVKCDSRKCHEHGQDALPFCEFSIVAVASAGPSNGGNARAAQFKAWVEATYPYIVDSASMPFSFDLIKMFDSSDAIDDYIKDPDYGSTTTPKIAMGIIWNGDDVVEYNYELRPNSTNYNSPEEESRPAARTMPSTEIVVDSFARDDESVCVPLDGTSNQGPYQFSCTGQYLYNGVLTFQRLVHDFILHQSGAAAAGFMVSESGVQFARFPTKSYESSGFYASIEGLGPFLVVLGLLYPVASMISYICKEKELRQKELMKMMSVTESDIGWSWFATFMALHFFTASLSAVLSTQLYENSDLLLLWVFWMLTLVSMVLFCMTIASLTAKAIRGVLIGLLAFFCGYFLTDAFYVEGLGKGFIQMISLHPVTAFSFGLDQIGRLEDNGVGLTWDSMDFAEHKSGYTFQDTINMQLFDCILWGFLTWYFNRVIVPDYGRALPWYFPFTTTYWCPRKVSLNVSDEDVVDKMSNSAIPYEPVSDALKRQASEGKSIEIHGLRKTFGDKLAVDGLDLSMYSGQITALLGHNGAGKTTTINMLTGAMSATEGYATIAGRDIRTDMQAIRRDIGVCLQHDCLFPDLTVREHVQFFSRLKGLYGAVSKQEAEEHIDQAIRDVALYEKRNTLSKNLSGGMKRKLSVAIAFCGGSKNVFLDEPTSGMDPFSRRFTWNVIRQYRKDRCIILTTHFMDEADILGDRIAIMAAGQLRCAGSPLFLKRNYGVGYQLTVEKNQRDKELKTAGVGPGDQHQPLLAHAVLPIVHEKDCREVSDYDDNEDGYSDVFLLEECVQRTSAILNNLVKSSVPQAALLNDVGTEARYQLPLEASDRFPAMFEQLDKAVNDGSIVSYGVSMTTLDEVFLLVARGDSRKDGRERLASSRMSAANNAGSCGHARMNLENEALFGRHLNALFKKRAMNFQRDKKAWCCTTVLPVLFVTLGFLIFSFASPERNLKPLTLDLSALNPDDVSSTVNPILFNGPGTPYSCQPGVCSFDALVVVNETNEAYTFCGAQSHLATTAMSLLIAPGQDRCSIRDSAVILSTLNGDDGAFPVEANVTTLQGSSHRLFESSSRYSASQYGAIWFTHEPSSFLAVGSSVNGTLASAVADSCRTFLTAAPVNYTTVDLCARFGTGYGYVIQYNHTSLHAAPLYQSLADQALLRYALNNSDVTITATVAPLPITPMEEGLGKSQDTYTAWFLVMLSFPFIAGAYASFVVVERESKAKHLQTVAGVEPSAYWISTLLWDALNYQIPLWLVVAEMFIFKVTALTSSDVFSGVLALLSFYGPASAGFAYCWSFAFASPNLCNVFLIVTGFLVGFGGPLTVFMLTLLGSDIENPNESLVATANVLTWMLRFTPTFCLGKGLFFAINIESIALFEENLDLSVWTEPVLLVEVIFLVLQGIGYTCLAVLLDIWSSNPQLMRQLNRLFGSCASNKDKALVLSIAPEEDSDVLTEQDRVLSGGASSDLIVLNQLSKTFGNGKVAVSNLSLGIRPGQCFGLLGINGAGKTTTMGMLTAEFPPTSGDATLAGFSISREPQMIRRRIGYCPQFDAHFAQLSGRNHVELYAAIKGVPEKYVKEAAARKLEEVGLSASDSDRLCADYSGGMKRRLSLACATIGGPQIMFLDECSTGVDPVARREIWQLVSDMVSTNDVPEHERPSVVLTTHSMEECEALCPRIGIMANGRLRCLGSAQHLKTKFGQGYQVELKAKLAESGDVDYSLVARALVGSVFRQSYDLEAGDNTSEACFDFDHTMHALRNLTGDDFLADMICIDDPTGYAIWRDSTSALGVPIDTLAVFATNELRMRKIASFMERSFDGQCALRERQDSKARYEVDAAGARISSIFATMEANKDELQLADYGVSQTSLEQVFNMHAAEAEKLKRDRDER